jgi:hypothetical protein
MHTSLTSLAYVTHIMRTHWHIWKQWHALNQQWIRDTWLTCAGTRTHTAYIKTMHCYNHTALADTDIHAYIYSQHEDITGTLDKQDYITGIHHPHDINMLAYLETQRHALGTCIHYSHNMVYNDMVYSYIVGIQSYGILTHGMLHTYTS